jgi:hypothetical protein
MVALGQVDLAGNDVVVNSIIVGTAKAATYTPGATLPTVTQATNRTTGVTINAQTGNIVTNTASLAAEASATFVVTNSKVSINDVVILAQRSGSNGGGTDVLVSAVTNGTFSITVTNNNAAAGTAETGAIIINFAIVHA